MRLIPAAAPLVTITQGGNTAAVLAALADAVAQTNDPLLVMSQIAGYNGSTSDRVRSEGTDRDGVAVETLGNLQTLGFQHGFNGTSWDRIRTGGSAGALLGSGRVTEVVNPSVQSDTGANDSDKTLTVPSDTHWHILALHVGYTSDGTSGNRQLQLQIQNAATTVVWQQAAGAVQAASNAYNYEFQSGVVRETSVINGELNIPLPNMWLPAAYKLRVYDSAAIAASSDDMLVHLLVDVRSI